MTVYSCLGPTAIENELRKCVAKLGGVVFKLEIDDSSILLSFEVVPGDTLSRKAHYVPYAPGCLAGAFDDMRNWVSRIVGRQ